MKRIIIIVAVVGALGSLVASAFVWITAPRIAYVRSFELVDKYAGTVEARAAFEKKKSAMLSNVDSMKMYFNQARGAYIKEMSTLPASKRNEREQELSAQHSQLIQYGEVIDQKIKEEDAVMMNEVLGQINSYVEEYAKENNFDIIMGTTASGSLLYGDESLDVTEDILDELNKKYQGR